MSSPVEDPKQKWGCWGWAHDDGPWDRGGENWERGTWILWGFLLYPGLGVGISTEAGGLPRVGFAIGVLLELRPVTACLSRARHSA